MSGRPGDQRKPAVFVRTFDERKNCVSFRCGDGRKPAMFVK